MEDENRNLKIRCDRGGTPAIQARFTVPETKERITVPLGTNSMSVARERRDVAEIAVLKTRRAILGE